MQVCNPCHYTLVEAIEPSKLHPMPMSYVYKVFEHLLRLWIGLWLHTHTFITTDTSPIWKSWLKSYLMQVSKLCHYTLIDAVETFQIASHVHGIHIYGVWGSSQVVMGVWFHTHINDTTGTYPDLWELGEILPDASVQAMPLHFDWGCWTFQTASHVHFIHIWGVWVPSQVVDGHMASH